MTRPEFTTGMTAAEFASWYWLKSELQTFCRMMGLSPAGAKEALTHRIQASLSGGDDPGAPPLPGRNAAMPEQFDADTVIASGWRCTQPLRQYFMSVHGRSFTFNAALRVFIANGCGKTLADASACYEATKNKPAETIANQFEFNRHMRTFHSRNPGASHEQAIRAWWRKRSKPDA